MRDGGKIAESGTMPAGELQANTRSPPTSVQALLRGHDLGAHVLVHHAQRRLAEFGVDVRDAVGRHDHLEMAHIGVERGVEDALLGDLSGQDQSLGLQLAQQIGQRGGVEGAVPDLLQEPARPLSGTIGLTRSGRSPSSAWPTRSS